VAFLQLTPLQHAGLALSVGLGACLNATLLWVTLQKTVCIKLKGICGAPGKRLIALCGS